MDGILVMSECDVLDIHGIMKGLAENRPIFHSEADFQFALAWHIRETVPECEIRLEFNVFHDESEWKHLDIWIPSHRVAIELKHPTKKLSVEHKDERFELKNTGRGGNGRYNCVKDIARVERIIEQDPDAHGFTVLLTNSRDLWNSGRTSNEDAFRLHQGRVLTGRLDWASNPPKDKDSINLNGSYEMCWCDYSNLGSQKNSQFRYLAVKVGK